MTSALVLGGGGSSGNAWAIGALAGLGLDVTGLDLVVGTSSGATTAAQVTVTPAADLYAAVLEAGPGPSRPSAGPVVDHLARTNAIIAAAADAPDMRRRLGAAALELPAAEPERWRGVVAARLPSPDWPELRMLVTAVDARTGEPVVFDRDSGVTLVDAVAASTSSGVPHAIGEGRYLDGGYRRNENADLAAGCDRVLVLSPFGGATRMPRAWGTDLATQVEELRAGGSAVEVVVPGEGTEHLFGAYAVDLSLRPEAARAGYADGVAATHRVAALWR